MKPPSAQSCIARGVAILSLLLVLVAGRAAAGTAEEAKLVVGERLKIGIVGGLVPGEPLWIVRRIESGGTVDLPGGVILAVAGLERSAVEREISTRFNGGRVVISRLDRGEDHGGAVHGAEAVPLHPELSGLVLEKGIHGTLPFEAVLDVLREQTDLSFFVNFSAMELEGVDRTQEVTLDLPSGTSLRQALDIVLEQISNSFVELCWQVDGPLVHVTTKDDLARHAVTTTYDLTQFLWLGSEIEARKRPATSHPIEYEEAVEQVIQLIIDTVEPDSWKDNGGSVGAVTELNGSLVVTQTRPAHVEIRKMLETLERDAEARLAALLERQGR